MVRSNHKCNIGLQLESKDKFLACLEHACCLCEFHEHLSTVIGIKKLSLSSSPMAVVMSSIEAVKASISLVLAATIFGVSGICEAGRHGVAHLLQVTSDCTALRSIAGVVDRECREAGLHDQCEASSDHSRPNFQGGCSCCLQECTTDLLGGDLDLQEGRCTRKSFLEQFKCIIIIEHLDGVNPSTAWRDSTDPSCIGDRNNCTE